MLEDAAAAAQRVGAVVSSARGHELEQRVPYGVVRDLLEPALADFPDPLEGAAAVGARVLGAAAAEPGGTEEAGGVVHGLYALTAALAARGPRALLVDDAHWADAARFRRLAAELNAATGLEDAIEIVDALGHELPFADASFDLIWTQAVLPNVADVAPLAAEAHRVLAPGGRWALAETVAGPGGDPYFPVPWADGPDGSHLLAPEALRTTLERPGFAAEVWEVGPAAVAPAVAELTSEPADPNPPVELGLIMPDRDERMASLGRNIAEQRIAPVLAVLRRAP